MTETQNLSPSDQQTSQNQSPEASEKVLNAIKEEGKPKYAGKFDTVEALEEGYRNSSKVFQENIDLKKQLDSHTKVPDEYEIPQDVKMQEGEIKYLKSIAKKAGFNQDQFSKTVTEFYSSSINQTQQFENRQKEIGEKDLILLKHYVKTVHPNDERLQNIVLHSLIMDDSSRVKALEHRSKLLNSEVPGMDKPTITGDKNYDGQKELDEAYKAHKKNPRDTKALERYVELSKEVGHARFGEKIKQMRS